MSTVRRLVLTADPALLLTDAPPAGVPENAEPVSYTHLTLPTIYSV